MRLVAIYRIRAEASAIEARAQGLAVEQSVEMPLAAIEDAAVLDGIVGRVESIRDRGDGSFEVRLALAAATVTSGDDGACAGQLLNMLFGNCSLQDDVALEEVELPEPLVRGFGGPRLGLAGLRDMARVGAGARALTCSALKPQGLPSAALADLAGRLARGGLDFIKDDHGLADQHYSRFAERVPAVAEAVAAANSATGGHTQYLPSLSGDLDALRRQVAIARAAGVTGALAAPVVIGLPAFHRLAREHPDFALMAHPALAGTARIAPPLLFGRLFRLFGADAIVFPNYGGRFGYSPATCRALAAAAVAPWHGLRGAVPVPAGGMTLDRVSELLDFYGTEVMVLIGGSLLAAGARVTGEAAALVRRVHDHGH